MNFGMKINKFELILVVLHVCIIFFARGSDGPLTVQLVNGGSIYQGRVEVYYNKQWGSICDDHWDNANCAVVCKQMGYTGGYAQGGAKYGLSAGPIWLDDVKCIGDESNLAECQHAFWGNHDCSHSEDASCECNPPAGAPVVGCDKGRHRITSITPGYPGIGRVEVQRADGVWEAVCDDFWDDLDAAVVCKCLGYSDAHLFRAYWSEKLSTLPQLPIGYAAMHCSESDAQSTQSLWACSHVAGQGKCDKAAEAAGIACEAPPPVTPPPAPVATPTCSGQTLTVCFTSGAYALSKDYLSVSPACLTAQPRAVAGGVCVDVNMGKCPATVTSDPSYKHYCYEVMYSQYDQQAETLIMDAVWRRRACCSVAKNGTVSASFQPLVPTVAPIYATAPVNFSMQCFLDEAFAGPALQIPVEVNRGQDMFCKITAHAWDDQLYLIVPNCRFMGKEAGTPSFTFLQDKCPTAESLGISYYSFDKFNWGVKFQVPQFQGYSQLFLSCDGYVCDTKLDSKPYCDRSCIPEFPVPAANKIKRSIMEPGGDTLLVELLKGPFTIKDAGFGPLFADAVGVANVDLSGETVEGKRNSLKSSTKGMTARLHNTQGDWKVIKYLEKEEARLKEKYQALLSAGVSLDSPEMWIFCFGICISVYAFLSHLAETMM